MSEEGVHGSFDYVVMRKPTCSTCSSGSETSATPAAPRSPFLSPTNEYQISPKCSFSSRPCNTPDKTTILLGSMRERPVMLRRASAEFLAWLLKSASAEFLAWLLLGMAVSATLVGACIRKRATSAAEEELDSQACYSCNIGTCGNWSECYGSCSSPRMNRTCAQTGKYTTSLNCCSSTPCCNGPYSCTSNVQYNYSCTIPSCRTHPY